MFCCLLALICLLPGCERKSPLLAHADDIGDLKTDYAAIDLIEETNSTKGMGYTIENEEGETLSLVRISKSQPSGPVGTMESLNEAEAGHAGFNRYKIFQVPFSKTYTVSALVRPTYWVENRGMPEDEVMELKNKTQSRVSYYSEGNTIEQLTEGYYAMEQTDEDYYNKIVHHCNNVVELYGDLSELWVCFNITEGTKFGKPDVGKRKQRVEGQNTYIVHGSGKDHVIIALVDGEIRTEGMVGNYTVTRRLEDEDSDARLEYDETGKLLHTETGYYQEEFHDFRLPAMNA